MGTFIQTPAVDAEETEGALQLGPERARVFTDLSAKEKEMYKADIRATNILLQGIPKDILNTSIKSKEKPFTYTMLEWSRFITKVKLNKGLKKSNFDQLYAYLKQHEVNASENRMMMERFIQPTNDPLALVSNASVQQSSSTDNLIESLTNTLVLLTQSYKSHLPQTNNQLRTSSNARNKATVQDGRVVVQYVCGRYNANNQGRPFQRNNARGNVVARNAGGQNRGGNVNPGQAKPIKCYNCNGLRHIARELDLALNVDHIFKVDQYDAFDSDVDEAPNIQTMFMVNLSSEDPIYDEAGPSYDSNTPFEVQDHDTFVDHMDEYHEYVEDNEEHIVQSNVSSVRNDALMSILDEMHEQGVQSMSINKPDKVVNDSVTSELARYKELVGVYEQRAKFELTDRERKIDEQMRIIISDRNRKETSLKSELHSAQLQLRSTLNHHKIMREEAIILKKDFKQKEDKFLEEFLDIKRLKEKVEDRLYKQDQSVQTVHMICKPKSFYDEKNKVAIGYKNPLCLTRAKQVQPALYNGHVLVMSNHARPVVHDSEDTRDMAEITRKRMMEKMQSPLCVEICRTGRPLVSGLRSWTISVLCSAFCDSDLKLLRSSILALFADMNGRLDLIKGVGIFHQKSVSRTPQQNGVVVRRNRTLVEAARTMLDISIARLFGAMCYPTNDSEDLGKLQAKADIRILHWVYAPSRLRAIESKQRYSLSNNGKQFTSHSMSCIRQWLLYALVQDPSLS
ncbi:retrovirus-related pol polyprotein from transposon TNT 1-94 [Tanacetum coccineum]|uniref:Retrovirus-related pol polyprotein from transposon TNT 1-94 n=1 Tax=Tanacetum coccineum TaxID=301880 RepID=A0ABQ5GAU1_9ASTR